jgi:DNA-binding protein HU-beta
MTKADIVDIIAKGTGMTKVETAAVVDGFLATVSYSLQNGQRVELRGFGTFCLRERKEKHVPNPRTGEMMHIPHRIVPDFKPSAQMKSYVAEGMKDSGLFVSKTINNKININDNQTDIFAEIDRYFVDEE